MDGRRVAGLMPERPRLGAAPALVTDRILHEAPPTRRLKMPWPGIATMAVQRDDPYGAFNFKVTIAPDSGGEIKAGFSDVSGLGTEVIHADDRVGTDPANHPRKVPLMHKASEVTLKRCLAGGLALFQWIDQVRQGKQDAKATVTIELMSEDRSAAVLGWKLSGAQPSKFTGSTLAAKRGTEVAMEELVLVCEDIGME
jgi:phage tail-like protein